LIAAEFFNFSLLWFRFCEGGRGKNRELLVESMELGGLTGGSPIEERIVIVGGGIGGLACALALHRCVN
jgi:NADPH-dependent 2,4-dienoyl-CoA reductase/sulfur reductase-like enzyme